MTLNNKELTSKLKGSFLSSARETKMGQEQIEQIGNILVKDFIDRGKKFTTSTVAKIIVDNKIADYSKCTNADQAIKTAARKALQSLGVIPAPVKKGSAETKNEEA